MESNLGVFYLFVWLQKAMMEEGFRWVRGTRNYYSKFGLRLYPPGIVKKRNFTCVSYLIVIQDTHVSIEIPLGVKERYERTNKHAKDWTLRVTVRQKETERAEKLTWSSLSSSFVAWMKRNGFDCISFTMFVHGPLIQFSRIQYGIRPTEEEQGE